MNVLAYTINRLLERFDRVMTKVISPNIMKTIDIHCTLELFLKRKGYWEWPSGSASESITRPPNNNGLLMPGSNRLMTTRAKPAVSAPTVSQALMRSVAVKAYLPSLWKSRKKLASGLMIQEVACFLST